MRSRPPILLAVSVAALVAGCKPPEGLVPKLAELAPEQAAMAVGFRLAPLQGSPIGELAGAAALADPDLGAVIAAVKACELDVGSLRASIAGRLDESSDDLLAIVESPGIGKSDALECLERESSRAAGESPGVVALRNHGPVRVAPIDGGGSLVQFNDDAVGVVVGTWEKAVLDRVENAEARAEATELGAALALARTDAAIWLAAPVDAGMRADFADFEGADALSHLTFEVDLEGDATAKLGLWFGDAEKAGAFGAVAQVQREAFAELGQEAGLSPKIMSSLAFTVDDRTVHATLTVPQAELTSLAAMAGVLFE